MTSAPLPFCVCESPIAYEGGPKKGDCMACGKPLPPQGEKCCDRCWKNLPHPKDCKSCGGDGMYPARCVDENCHCHKESSVKEVPYSRRDHTHCREVDNPPCGLAPGHPVNCCLCGKETPGSAKEGKKLGEGGICIECNQNICYCPQRQTDGSWKETPVEGWEETLDNTSALAGLTGGRRVWLKHFIRTHLKEAEERAALRQIRYERSKDVTKEAEQRGREEAVTYIKEASWEPLNIDKMPAEFSKKLQELLEAAKSPKT